MRFREIISEKLIDNPVGRVARQCIRAMRMSPKGINNGWCSGFAHKLADRLGDGAKVVSTSGVPGGFPGHSVVFYQGAYYDAENPDGVPSIADLTYCKRLRAIADSPADEPLDEGVEAPAIDPDVAAQILKPGVYGSAKRGVKIPPTATLWRGESEDSGRGMATLGGGLYFTANKKYAAQYGKVSEISRTMLPDNALRFDTSNEFQIWLQRAFVALGYEDNRSFRAAYHDLSDFIRALDPSIDGIQLFTGKDAVFVLYSGELEEGEVVPFKKPVAEPIEEPGDTEHGEGWSSTPFNVGSLAGYSPPITASEVTARRAYMDEAPAVHILWNDYRSAELPIFQLSRILKLAVGQSVTVESIGDNRNKHPTPPNRTMTWTREPDMYLMKLTHYLRHSDDTHELQETGSDYVVNVHDLHAEAQKVMKMLKA